MKFDSRAWPHTKDGLKKCFKFKKIRQFAFIHLYYDGDYGIFFYGIHITFFWRCLSFSVYNLPKTYTE